MAPSLPRVQDILSLATLDSSPDKRDPIRHGMLSVMETLDRYEQAMKEVIEPMLSNDANRMTEHTINAVTELLDELYDMAEEHGSSKDTLRYVNQCIEGRMQRLVHDFSGYLKDEVEELRVFTALLNTRRNEAIWCEVFTYYFHFSKISVAPPSLAAEIISRFWDCFLFAQEADLRNQPLPYYENRVSKIMYEKIYPEMGALRNTKFIALFENYSLAIAENSPEERKRNIYAMLSDADN